MARVLVTGHRGFIGKNLVKKLKNRGYELNLLSGDITKPETIIDCAKKSDIVIHLAGKLMDNSFDDSHYRVNVTGTKNMLNEAKKAGARFIFISTAGIYEPCINAKENTPPNPRTPYEKTKLEAEKLVKDSGLDYVILRPGIIFGPGDRRFMKIFRMARRGFFPLIDSGRNLIQPLFVEDFTDILIKIIEKDINNELFVVAGERQVSVREFAKMINKKIIFIPLCSVFMMPFAKLADLLSKILKRDFLINSQRVNFFTETRTVSISKLKKRIKPEFITLEKAVEITEKSL